jgi:hypothetical protein
MQAQLRAITDDQYSSQPERRALLVFGRSQKTEQKWKVANAAAEKAYKEQKEQEYEAAEKLAAEIRVWDGYTMKRKLGKDSGRLKELFKKAKFQTWLRSIATNSERGLFCSDRISLGTTTFSTKLLHEIGSSSRDVAWLKGDLRLVICSLSVPLDLPWTNWPHGYAT